jgi:tRNA pseudouridine55 synthase
MDGLLVVDKPVGPTSHDVVKRVRRILREQGVGHTGTLDPGASGVLPLLVGRATRLARYLNTAEKSYRAVVRLGVATDSADSAGRPIGERFEGTLPGRESIDRALDEFRGTFIQQPPAYSAKKIGGERSHRLARSAARAASPAFPASPALPAPVSVTVHLLELESVEGGRVTIRVDCSAGFYIRALADDLGVRLGTGAHVEELRRLRSGDVTLADAITLAALENDPERAAAAVVPLARMLPALPPLTLTEEGARRAGHGRDLGPSDFDRGLSTSVAGGTIPIRLFDKRGELVGVAELAAGSGLLHPTVVLV